MVSPFRDGLAAAREQLLSLEQQRRALQARIAGLKERVQRARPKPRLLEAIGMAIQLTVLLACAGFIVVGIVGGTYGIARRSTWPIIVREAALEETKRIAKEAKLSFAQSASMGFRPCPSIMDLITEARLDPRKAEDPWGRRYRIVCASDETVWVYSAGEDGVAHTADDIANDMPRSNLETLEELSR
jgi:hypothetical protein